MLHLRRYPSRGQLQPVSSPLIMDSPNSLVNLVCQTFPSVRDTSLPWNVNPPDLREACFHLCRLLQFSIAGSCSHISLILRLSHTVSLLTSPQNSTTVEEIEARNKEWLVLSPRPTLPHTSYLKGLLHRGRLQTNILP